MSTRATSGRVSSAAETTSSPRSTSATTTMSDATRGTAGTTAGEGTPAGQSSILDLVATLRTSGRAGFVFDRYDDGSFKFVAIDVALAGFAVRRPWIGLVLLLVWLVLLGLLTGWTDDFVDICRRLLS